LSLRVNLTPYTIYRTNRSQDEYILLSDWCIMSLWLSCPLLDELVLLWDLKCRLPHTTKPCPKNSNKSLFEIKSSTFKLCIWFNLVWKHFPIITEQSNRVFATDSNFLFPLSLQPDSVNFWNFILKLLDLTKLFSLK